MADSRAFNEFEPPAGTLQPTSGEHATAEPAADRPYAIIRRYEGLDPRAIDEVRRQVNDGLVPIISQLPGFLAYCALHTGGDVVAAISIFEDRAGADESTRRAAKWVEEHLANLVPHPPQFTAGTVMAYKVK
ncbi:MAG: hypothetical protein M3O34_02845 [Chloroflexota bacterium]|nr:hypothetical protein [Chloroflexota bacterium]